MPEQVGIRWQGPKYQGGIVSLWPKLVPSFGPIGHETKAAEPPWVHGLAGEHQGEVPDHDYPHQTFGAQQLLFPELCPEMPH